MMATITDSNANTNKLIYYLLATHTYTHILTAIVLAKSICTKQAQPQKRKKRAESAVRLRLRRVIKRSGA